MPIAKVTIRNTNGPALRESTHDGLRFVGGTIHIIHYDTIEAFVDAGIMMRSAEPSSSSGLRLPTPFPASAPAYCPRPTQVQG